jgi:hypothetical protein
MNDRPPVVWAVLSDKAGDNAQVEAVIERLPWPVTVKRLHFRRPFVKGKPPFFASLYHVDKARSDALAPPWPDLVITIGRRPAMAALWIRKQSGDRTRVVLFGRPKRHPRHFALIVAAPQFLVDEGDNVLTTTLPLMRVDEARLEAARASWRDVFAGLPRPLVAVLVGGATRPYAFGADEADELIRFASRYAAGGTLYVTTSRRTGAAAAARIEAALPNGARLWKWGDSTANPYVALLACADAFVVTGDSMSMITEVARLKRPLAIYPLPLRPITRWARAHLPAALARIPERVKYAWLPRLGVTAFPRDLGAIHRRLVADGRAVFAGAPLTQSHVDVEDDLERVARAIVACLSPNYS